MKLIKRKIKVKLNKYNVIFKPSWIETIDRSRTLIYSDTDSQYTLIKLPFNKFEDREKTVDYTQVKAKQINNLYLEILNTRLKDRANLDPDYNFMNFKSEVVAYRGFFRSKKYYSLSKIWDEGNYFDKPKLKYTGGPIKKADTTPLTRQMLFDIYDLLTLNFDVVDEYSLCKNVFIDIKNKYLSKLTDDIKSFNLDSFGIPKKWGLNDFKVLPSHILGGMLFNTIISDNLRPGDSMIMFQIKIKDFKRLLQKNNEIKTKSPFQLPTEKINKKLKYMCVPYGYHKNEDNLKKLLKSLDEFNIELDFDGIIDFNIHKKIIQFEPLFDEILFKKLGIKLK